jgi:hypothetical protein
MFANAQVTCKAWHIIITANEYRGVQKSYRLSIAGWFDMFRAWTSLLGRTVKAAGAVLTNQTDSG